MSGKDAAARAHRRPLRSRALTLWSLGYLLIGVALTAAAAWPVYEIPRAIIVAAVGGLTGIALGALVRARRLGAVLGTVAAFAAYLVLAVPLAVPSGLASASAFTAALRDAVLGVVVGWKQILTLAPPLGEYQAVLVPLLVVSLFGAFLATLFALHPGRRAAAAVVVVAAMCVFGVAFGLSAPSRTLTVGPVSIAAPRELAIGVALFMASLAWLIGRTRLQRAAALRAVAALGIARRGTPVWAAVRRRLLAGSLVVAALVAGALVAPAAAGWSDRSVLRDAVEPMVVVREQPSPLASYRSWFAQDRLDETVLSIDGDTGAIDRIRLVTLDRYDGQDFHVSPDTRFSRLPRTSAAGSERAEVEITIGDGYRGIWMPVPGALVAAPQFAGERADALADGFHVDDAGDTAITIAEAPGGGRGLVAGDRYAVVAAPSAGGRDDLSATEGGQSLLDAEAHPELVDWAQLQGQSRTGAGYLELVDRLRSRGYLSHALLDDEAASGWISALESEGYSFAASYAGHSSARVEEVFASLRRQEVKVGSDAPPEMLVSAVGDDEQFAAAAALLARYWGFESRVVIGARLAAAEDVPGVAACTDVCTGGSMSAWVEVRAPGAEWVAVDVTPQFALLPSTITEGEQLPEHPTIPEQPRSEALDPPQAQNDSQADAAPLDESEQPLLAEFLPVIRTVAISLLVALLLILPLLTLLIAKMLRRRRRASGDAELRLVGAWEELVDLYLDHGVTMPGDGTRVQRAEAATRPAAGQLARLVDTAVFSPHPSADADAAVAWEIVDRERSELDRGSRRWRRLRSRLRMRSFLERIRSPRKPALSARKPVLDTLTVAGARRQEEDA